MIKYDKDALLDKEQKLKYIYLQVKNILDNLGIKFVVTHGTCLGAVRHGRILPWDININILLLLGNCPECVKEDYDLFYKLFKVLESIVPTITPEIIWEEWDVLWNERKYQTKGASLWFPAEPDNFRVELAIKPPEDVAHCTGKLEQVKLYGDLVYVPTPPEDYLSWGYGKSWNDVYCPWKDWYTGQGQKVMSGTIPEDLIQFTKEVKEWWNGPLIPTLYNRHQENILNKFEKLTNYFSEL